MKKILFIAFIFLALPFLTQAQYTLLDDFEDHNDWEWQEVGSGTSVVDSEYFEYRYNQTTGVEYRFTGMDNTHYKAFSGAKNIYTYHSPVYIHNKATTTSSSTQSISYSYMVNMPKPTTSGYGAGYRINSANWAQICVTQNTTESCAVSSSYAFYDIDTEGYGMVFHSWDSTETPIIGNAQYDTWVEVFIEYDAVNHRIRGYIGDSEWSEWSLVISNDYPDHGAYFEQIYFSTNNIHEDLTKIEYQANPDDRQPVRLDDIKINGTAGAGRIRGCDIYYNEYDAVSFLESTDFTPPNPVQPSYPRYSGFVYTPDSPCTVGVVEMRVKSFDSLPIEVAEDIPLQIQMQIYEVPDVNSDVSVGGYITGSLLGRDIDYTGITMSEFRLAETVILEQGKNYSFVLKPLKPLFEEYPVTGGFDVAHYDVANSNGDIYNNYMLDGIYSETHNVNTQFNFINYEKKDILLDFDLPCIARYGENVEGECTIAVENTEEVGAIDFTGYSYNRNDSTVWWGKYFTEEYLIYEKMSDYNGNILYESTSYPLAVGVEHYITGIIPFGTYLHDLYGEKAMYKYDICQIGIGDEYNDAVQFCIRFNIGWNMTENETENFLDTLGKRSISEYVADECQFNTWEDYINVYKGLKCGLIWAFIPESEDLAKFYEVKDDMLLMYPIGYATFIYKDVSTAFTSTSTAFFDKEIEIGRWFGRTGGTTTIEMDNLLKYRTMYAKIEELFATIMWTLFAFGLLMWGITRKL